MRNMGWIATAAALTLFVGSANAGVGWSAGPNFGDVGQTSSEATFIEILEGVYGGTFTGANSKDFGDTSYTNGTITLTRIEDYNVGSPLNLLTGAPGAANDQVWQDGVVDVVAEARYAGVAQKFGYYDAADTSSYTELFSVAGAGLAVTGSAANVSLGSQFGWVRKNDSPDDSGPHFSVDSDNKDGLNHMLTYQITGPGVPGVNAYMLWFEDLNDGDPGADWDFNDLVVEVRVIPAPAAALLGLLGLGMTGWIKRRQA